MKLFKIGFVFSMLFISCNLDDQANDGLIFQSEIKIPSVEKNKKDAHFKLKNGVLFFKEKKYSGIVNEFYPKGEIKSMSQYYEGQREGMFFGWYSDGTHWFERFYKKGLKSSTHKGWYNNGNQMFLYHFNNKGRYHGAVKDWHPNGILGKHFNFMEGKERGSQKMWDLDGKIKANFYTVENERHGLIGLKNCISIQTLEKK